MAESKTPVLPLRREDCYLVAEHLSLLEVTCNLQNPPPDKVLRNQMALRRYAAGDVICQQAEPGGTGFYLLRWEDAIILRKSQIARWRKKLTSPSQPEIIDTTRAQLAAAEADVAEIEAELATPSSLPRLAATAHVVVNGQSQPEKPEPGFVNKLKSKLFGDKSRSSRTLPEIASDGPADIDARTYSMNCYQGEVYGEMSCNLGTPRAATIVAANTCLIMEFTPAFLQAVQLDPAYRQVVDGHYRRRGLIPHLRHLPGLEDATAATLQQVAQHVEFEVLHPGEAVCRSNETASAAYLVRSGVAVAGAESHGEVAPHHVTDWAALCRALVDEAKH